MENGGRACNGNPEDTQECNANPCPGSTLFPNTVSTSKIGQWNYVFFNAINFPYLTLVNCTLEKDYECDNCYCDEGTKMCTKIDTKPGEKQCEGDETITETCNIEECPGN